MEVGTEDGEVAVLENGDLAEGVLGEEVRQKVVTGLAFHGDELVVDACLLQTQQGACHER